MSGGSKMFRVKNVSKKFIKFQGATIAPNDYFDYAKIYDYVTYTRFINSNKISCFEVESPKNVAEEKVEKVEEVVETVKVEQPEKETTEDIRLFNNIEKTDEVTEDTKVSDDETEDTQKDNKSGRGRRKKS